MSRSVVPSLRGPRLLLRAVADGDRGRLQAIMAEQEVARWWRRDTWDRLLGAGLTTCAIEARGDPAGGVVGMIQFDEELDPAYRRASIDLFLSSRLHGRGLGAEAIRTLIRHLIDERGHHRFTIDPAVENERAVRCYGNVGFRTVGVMRRYERVAPGVYRDALLMELLAGELMPYVSVTPDGVP